MKRLPDTAFWTANAGMELSWVYAWAVFIVYSISKRPYPLPDAVAIFTLAALFTVISRGRGWRIVQILLLHGIGLIVFSFRTVQVFWYGSEAFWSRGWLADFFGSSRQPLEWMIFLVFLGWTLVFWVSGIKFVRRPTSYFEICSRFDRGFAAFFFLLLVKLVMQVQVGVQSGETTSEFFLFPFFLFALLSVALARNRSTSQKDFLVGYRGIGLILSFSAAVLFFGTGLVLLFLPYLKMASEAGYEILKVSGKHLIPILLSILKFIFGYSKNQPPSPDFSPRKNPAESMPEVEPSWWMALFQKIFVWSSAGLFGLMIVLLFCVGTWFLLRWLFSRTEKYDRKEFDRNLFLLWKDRLIAYFLYWYGKLFGGRKGHASILLYGALLRWGRHSGFRNQPSETPLEYGFRLKRQFSAVNEEIDSIVAVFNLYVYGQTFPNEQQLAGARRALKKLKRPTLWPNRFKAWFLNC